MPSLRALEAPPWLLQQHCHLADVPHTRQQVLHGGGLTCPHTGPRHVAQLLHATMEHTLSDGSVLSQMVQQNTGTTLTLGMTEEGDALV